MTLRNHLYVGGNEINIADFQLYSQIYDFNLIGRTSEEVFKDCPKLLDWYNRCSTAKGLKDEHDNERINGIKEMVVEKIKNS